MWRTTVRSATTRLMVNEPDSPVAAWLLRLPGGYLFVTNAAAVQAPGDQHYAEAWYRLNGVIRGRACCVLLVAEMASMADHLAGFSHVAC